MHSRSATASLCDVQSPDLAVARPQPFPSLSSYSSSNSSFTSSLVAYSQLLLGSELEPVPESPGFLHSEVSYSAGNSGPCSSYGSPTSQPGSTHRSVSSHSLRNNGLSLPPGAPISALFDTEGPMRRVYSAGDLQGRVERTWSSESNLIIEGMAKACRYSPEEKRERIERYKTKRNKRNFNKKIKYECRKTLADSRRRIRGRFARNEETEKNNSTAEDDGSWITFLDSCSVNFVIP